MRRDTTDRTAAPLHLASAFIDRDGDKKYLHKFLDVTRSQLLFARGAIFVEGITEAMLMQRFSEIIGHNLRDAAIEIVVIDGSDGYEHFRPLFDNGEDTYCRAIFITDGDESPQEVKSDEELKADSNSEFDQGLTIEGSTGIASGYGTFEFGLLRTSIINGDHPAMQSLLKSAMMSAAPATVAESGKQEMFARDFFDVGCPALSYQKMKERKEGVYVKDPGRWYGTWKTGSYFRKAKSDFAFHLNEALSAMSVEDAHASFTVPKYIADAIRWVVGGATIDEEERNASDP